MHKPKYALFRREPSHNFYNNFAYAWHVGHCIWHHRRFLSINVVRKSYKHQIESIRVCQQNILWSKLMYICMSSPCLLCIARGLILYIRCTLICGLKSTGVGLVKRPSHSWNMTVLRFSFWHATANCMFNKLNESIWPRKFVGFAHYLIQSSMNKPQIELLGK